MSEPGVNLIERDNFTARAYQVLREALMEGRFPPGHRFKIRELAQMLGVSMTPVREALMQLVRERALEIMPGRSIEVSRLTLAQYLELRTIRSSLEGMAAEKAATRISPETFRNLRSCMTNSSMRNRRRAGAMPYGSTGNFIIRSTRLPRCRSYCC